MAQNCIKREKMRKKDADILLRYTVDIEKELDTELIEAYMFSNCIIDYNDKDKIASEKTPINKTKMFLQMLPLRGPNAFTVFLESLDDAGYQHLAEKLRGQESISEDNWVAIRSVASKVKHLDTRSQTVENRVNDMSEQIQGVLSVITETNMAVESLGTRTKTIEKELKNAEVRDLTDQVKALSLVMTEIKDVITRLEETDITELKKELKEKDDLLSEARKKINKLEQENFMLRDKIEKQSKRVQTLETTVSKHEEVMTELESKADNERRQREKESEEAKLSREKYDKLLQKQEDKNQTMEAEISAIKAAVLEQGLANKKKNPRPAVKRHAIPAPKGTHPLQQLGVRVEPKESMNRFDPKNKTTTNFKH